MKHGRGRSNFISGKTQVPSERYGQLVVVHDLANILALQIL